MAGVLDGTKREEWTGSRNSWVGTSANSNTNAPGADCSFAITDDAAVSEDVEDERLVQ